jgi:hypothetical protein
MEVGADASNSIALVKAKIQAIMAGLPQTSKYSFLLASSLRMRDYLRIQNPK